MDVWMDRCREMIHGQIDDRKIDRYYMRTEMVSSLGFLSFTHSVFVIAGYTVVELTESQ